MDNLDNFFELVKEEKKRKEEQEEAKRKEEEEKKKSTPTNSNKTNPSENLGEFFSLVGKAKQKKKEEFHSLVGDIDLDIDSLFSEVKKSVKEDAIKNKKIKETEERQIKALESWLYSDSNDKKDEVSSEEVANDILEEELINSDVSPENDTSEVEEVEEVSVEIEEKASKDSEEVREEDNYIDDALRVLETIKTKEEVQEQTSDPEIIKIRRELEYLKNLVSMQGGGGEVRLEFLDDVDRDSAKVDGKVLSYQASTGKFVGVTAGVGGGGVGGVGLSTTGISTAFGLHIDPVGSGTTFSENLVVIGDARITGILTIGTESITLDSNDNSIEFDDVKIRRDHSSGDIRFLGSDGNLRKIIASEVSIGAGSTAIVMTNRGGTIKFVKDAESDEEMSVGIGTTASINTIGIITATRFFAGLTEVINSSGEFVGKSFAANVDGGLPSSVYGGIPVIDGGGV